MKANSACVCNTCDMVNPCRCNSGTKTAITTMKLWKKKIQ